MGQTFVTATAPRNRAAMVHRVREAAKQSNRTAAQNSLDAVIRKAAKQAVDAALAKPRATPTANSQGFDWASVLPPGDDDADQIESPLDGLDSPRKPRPAPKPAPAQTGNFDWASTLPKE